MSPGSTSPAGAGGRVEIGTIYGAGLFQGLSLVAFPAAAPILVASSGYGLSKAAYGQLFLPQVALAILRAEGLLSPPWRLRGRRSARRRSG